MSGVAAADRIAATIGSTIGPDALLEDADLQVAGEPIDVAAAPASLEELAALMELAHRESWAVVPAGLGGWLDAGNPLRRADLAVSTRRLDRVRDYEPADLVVTVEAGVTVEALAPTLAEHRQGWPVDPPGGGTIGAVLATGTAGALATGYGTPRDLTLGLTVVCADGTILRPGGRVVKNVAGYDLVRLFLGSWGTLGIIAEAHLRLHPMPPADRTLVVFGDRISTLTSLVADLGRGDALLPVAAEIVSPSAAGSLGIETGEWQAAVRWRGSEAAVEHAVGAASDAASKRGLRAESRAADLWDGIAAAEPARQSPLVVRMSAPVHAAEAMIGLTRAFAGGQSPAVIAAPLRGRAWVWVSRALYESGGGERVWELRVRELRRALAERGGHVQVERAPPGLGRLIDAWGDPGAAGRLHQGLKKRFDPRGILNPGRFVAGT